MSEDQRRRGEDKARRSRLTKTAAGLVLIIGTGGTSGVLGGTAASASTPGEGSRPPSAVARVVDITHFSSLRRGSSPNKRPQGPTDDGGAPPAA